MKGNRAKSVSFGVVLTHPQAKRNSIISETSSVDITDGSKMSSVKRKPIIKLPYKTEAESHKKATKVYIVLNTQALLSSCISPQSQSDQM